MIFPNGTSEHPINKSKRKFLVSVWDFGTTNRKERSYYLCNDHPAKMRPCLARAILQIYGKPPVLDPMAGIGTTLVEAMLLGMDAVGIEYEKKFVMQANRNISYARNLFKGKNLGNAVCIQGDARELSRLNHKKLSSILFSSYFAVKDKHLCTKSFGSIIFSPPLGEANRGSGIAKRGYEGKYGKDEKLKDRCDRPLSKDKKNLSNIRYGRTYLAEMFKVYSECFKVLKPGNFMVVVVKDIQRDWRTVPLGADTIKLCQMAGFEVHDIIINKLYSPSFWILSLTKKSQREENKGKEKFHALRNHEYVLVFRKPK